MDRRDSTIGGPRLTRRGDLFSSQESLNSLLRPSSQEVRIYSGITPRQFPRHWRLEDPGWIHAQWHPDDPEQRREASGIHLGQEQVYLRQERLLFCHRVFHPGPSHRKLQWHLNAKHLKRYLIIINTIIDTKRVYYLSMEFLIGRHMQNALQNLRIEDTYAAALKAIGY